MQEWQSVNSSQPYPHEPMQSQEYYKLYVRKVDYILYNLEKQTIQTIVVKKQTPQAIVVEKSGHYKLF